MPTFKEEYNLEERSLESKKIRAKYQTRIPIIVQMNEKYGWFSRTEKLPALDKKKYLVPQEVTYSQFMNIIRKRLKLEPEKAMFMFIGKDADLPPSGANMEELYNEYKEEDGFIYFYIAGMSVFGN